MKKLIIFASVIASFLPEIIQAQTCGTTNIALSKPVTVSTETEFHEGSTAVDGNTATDWRTTSASGDINYIYVDLQQSYTICKVILYWSTNGRGKNYTVETSTDATNWTVIFTRSNNSAETDAIDLSGTGRYVRINLTGRVNNWSSYELKELEIYNSVAGNTKPTVSLTAPANNATFNAGENIELTATASDPDGSILKVEFYNGTVKIGEDASSPYGLTWSNVPAGSYTLTAKAYDNDNDDNTSTAVNITVNTASDWSVIGNAATNPAYHFLGTTDNQPLKFKTNNTDRVYIDATGFVTIGTDTRPNAEALLSVNGPVYAKKLKVTQNGWADYVFNKEYKLPTLREVEAYIKKHGHLPGVPAASDVIGKNLDVAQTQELLLKKIEELTLYVIELQKQIEELKK